MWPRGDARQEVDAKRPCKAGTRASFAYTRFLVCVTVCVGVRAREAGFAATRGDHCEPYLYMTIMRCMCAFWCVYVRACVTCCFSFSL